MQRDSINLGLGLRLAVSVGRTFLLTVAERDFLQFSILGEMGMELC